MSNLMTRPRAIKRRAELPDTRNVAQYDIDGTHKVTLKQTERQVLEALRLGPIFCASPIRLSHYTMMLRRHGIKIETEETSLKVDGENIRYGWYILQSDVALSEGGTA